MNDDDESRPSGWLRDPTAVADGELSKSGVTRRRIMDAAVHTLDRHGYAQTSTTEVARAAGMTRAAMLYHFPSRMSLIEATIHYVTQRRLDLYEEAMSSIPKDPAYFLSGIDQAWATLLTPEFRAFTELCTAARTDPELAAVFEPALAEFDRGRRACAERLFPKKDVEAPWFDLRRDIVRYLLEGLAHQDGLSFDAERRFAKIMAFLKVMSAEPEGRRFMRRVESWFAEHGEGTGRSR